MKRWHTPASGQGQVVLLSGEPGIGKSRIVQNLGSGSSRIRQRVVLLQCSPHHSNSALYPVGIALERLAEFDRDDSVERKLAKLEALVARCRQPVQLTVPLLAPVVSVPIGGPLRAHRGDAAAPAGADPVRAPESVEGLAMDSGLLLVFEDVHWIDPTSQEWLDVLVDRPGSQRMLAVITYRPGYAPRWIGRPHVTRRAP